MAPKKAYATVRLKMSVDEFGEAINQIMDALERGDSTVPTSLAVCLANHIHAILKEQKVEIDALHDKYAHEGGKPQIMTVEIARAWFSAIEIPSISDMYQTSVPNVFYATFGDRLLPEHIMQIKALGFDVIDPNSRLRNRWMLKWLPPRNDEC